MGKIWEKSRLASTMKPKQYEFCKVGKFSTHIYRYDWENFGKNIG
jgi:hypothetical protein